MKKNSSLGKRFVVFFGALWLASAIGQAQEPVFGVDLLSMSRQAVLMVCDNWMSTNGWLQRFNLEEQSWKAAGPAVRVSLGRNGLGWGRGLSAAPQTGPQKKEGDGRSPAGIFPLPYAFGKAPVDAMKGIRIPYAQITSGLECVDDTNSSHYNSIVDRTNAVVDWKSSEHMAAMTEYQLGVVVGHNLPAQPGAGSCIFLHVWGAPGKTTSGCTAMTLGDMEALVVWLDRSANPLLVQLPQAEYARLKQSWRLPELSTNAP
ncbi:MAG TPA: L,D-transpeptidase family protein [Verrucomicrobiae bacterium]|nr:L,D-transpeptidase family protein [Verrucomicrobiae bacterium]